MSQIRYVISGVIAALITAATVYSIKADMYDGPFETGKYQGFKVSAGFNTDRDGAKVAKIYTRRGALGDNVSFVGAVDMNHDEIFQANEIVHWGDKPPKQLERFANPEEMERIFQRVNPSRPKVERR